MNRPINTVFHASAGAGKTYQVTGLYQALILNLPYPDTAIGQAAPPGAIFAPSPAGALDCREIVMLTFARNAAAEMRERIHAALEERLAAAPPEQAPFYWGLLRRLAGAHISTIHAFAQRLLAENALRVGVPPLFQVLDESPALQLCRAAVTRTVLERLAQPDAGAHRLGELCRGLSVGRLVTILTDLLRRSRTLGLDLAGADRLAAPLPPPPTRAGIAGSAALLEAFAAGNKLGKNAAAMRAALEQCLRGLPEDAPPLAVAQQALELLPLAGGNWGRAAVELRQAIKARLLVMAAYAESLQVAPYLEDLTALAAAAAHAYAREKQAAGALDFDDLLMKTAGLLQSPTSRAEITDRVAVLIVDEAQDNSPLQNQMLRALWRLGGAALVACGDAKQTIHAWRGADPASIDSLTAGLPPENCLRVPLTVSYRSQRHLLEWINRIAASPDVFGANYAEADRLTPCPAADQAGTRGPNVELLLPPWEYAGDLREMVDVPGADAPVRRFQITAAHLEQLAANGAAPWAGWQAAHACRVSLEARALAARIRLLCDPQAGAGWRPPFIWDEAARGWAPARRAYRHRDIAILLRATTHQPVYEAALREWGIPFTTGGKGKAFFFRPVVKDLAALLAWLARPEDDGALLALARSPWVGLSDPALAILAWEAGAGLNVRRLLAALTAGPAEAAAQAARLRAESAPEDAAAYLRAVAVLGELRALAGRVPVVDLARTAVQLTGFDAAAAGGFNGAQQLANLRKCLTMIRDFACRESADLSAAARWLQAAINADEEPDAALFDAADDAVRICTVHAAKGLTFPVVFVPDLRRNLRREYAALQIAAQDGQPALTGCLPLPDENGRPAKRRGYLYDLASARRQEEQEAEHRRLFYVAITRARDLLVLSGENPRQPGKSAAWREWINRYLETLADAPPAEKNLMRVRAYTDLPAAAGAAAPPFIPTAAMLAAASSAASGRVSAAPKFLRLPATMLAAAMADPAAPPRLPAGGDWTGVCRAAGMADTGDGSRHDGPAAQAGSVKHAAMERWDYARAPAGQAAKLLAFIDPSAPAEFAGEISAAAESLAPDLRAADAVIREMPFVARFEHGGWTVVADGKLDLLYHAAGRWRLVDYKFSGEPDDALRRRYACQLWLYRAAITAPAEANLRTPRFETAHAAPAEFDLRILAVDAAARARLLDLPAPPPDAELARLAVDAARRLA